MTVVPGYRGRIRNTVIKCERRLLGGGGGHLNPAPLSPPRRWRLALGGGAPPPEEMAFGAGGSETPSLAVGVRSWGSRVRKGVDDGTLPSSFRDQNFQQH